MTVASTIKLQSQLRLALSRIVNYNCETFIVLKDHCYRYWLLKHDLCVGSLLGTFYLAKLARKTDMTNSQSGNVRCHQKNKANKNLAAKSFADLLR
jgi:hypothetical protein